MIKGIYIVAANQPVKSSYRFTARHGQMTLAVLLAPSYTNHFEGQFFILEVVYKNEYVASIHGSTISLDL